MILKVISQDKAQSLDKNPMIYEILQETIVIGHDGRNNIFGVVVNEIGAEIDFEEIEKGDAIHYSIVKAIKKQIKYDILDR